MIEEDPERDRATQGRREEEVGYCSSLFQKFFYQVYCVTAGVWRERARAHERERDPETDRQRKRLGETHWALG